MIDKNFFEKKFSVGLCLNEPFEEIQRFMVKNCKWLNSVYFSLPLGSRFFSREILEREYGNNEEKLFKVLDILTSLGIRREIAVNTWHLTDKEITGAITYCYEHDLIPEEIVCLREYGSAFRNAFPETEIKYSVNNPEADGSRITKDFDTLVAGKGMLRDEKARQEVIEKGYHLTLLLNNGCINTCNTICESIQCHRYYDHAISQKGLEEIFALCSFFPSELKSLLNKDKYAEQYKFKISNRPLGYRYTQEVIDSYLSLHDNVLLMKKDYHKLALFCTVHSLAIHMKSLDVDRIMQLKEQMKNGDMP